MTECARQQAHEMTGIGSEISCHCSVAARLEDCPPAHRELHRQVLRSFMASRVPRASDLDRWARDLGVDRSAALAELERRDAVLLDRADGSVAVAYPFCGLPTRHEVILEESGVRAFAMCAIDALGVAFMAGEPVIVRSSDPSTGEPIEVRADPADSSTWEPVGAGVVYRVWGEGPSASCRCPHINFVADRARAAATVDLTDKRPSTVLNVPQAIERGRENFGSLLDPS
ncbi:MAG: organomercurial lyase [Solirubrobacteraceae bacterium]